MVPTFSGASGRWRRESRLAAENIAGRRGRAA
jgi:hypothetical protein